MTFYIPGEPVGKERPRVANGHAYTPAKTKAYEEKVKWCFRQAHGRMLDGPIRMTIEAVYSIPKSASRKAREAKEGKPARKKPDLDNLVKCIADALNGMAYEDDKDIVMVTAFKSCGATPGVSVTVDAMTDEEYQQHVRMIEIWRESMPVILGEEET